MPPFPPAEFVILTAKSPIEPKSLREQLCVCLCECVYKCNLILMISLCYLFKTKSLFCDINVFYYDFTHHKTHFLSSSDRLHGESWCFF